MRKVELESLLKSFLLFFISLSFLTAVIFYDTYENKLYTLEESIYSQMQIASYDLDNTNFKVSVLTKSKNLHVNVINVNEKEIFVYFENKKSNDSLVRVSYPRGSFLFDKEIIFKQSINGFLKSLLVIFIVSIIFSLYALYPLKKSLSLTNEFIKDILHDFNTPLSTIRLNASILKSKIDNKYLNRIESSIDTILNLQNNLKEYIENDIKDGEQFDIKEVVLQRVKYMHGIYPHIQFETNIPSKNIYCYKDGLIRILDNILSNACKYNKQDGTVSILLDENGILKISDTGKGIRNPKKIFRRFYKETSRGLGIGLHIVQKLSNKMNINITVQSQINIGTTFTLNLSKLILN